MDTLEHDTAQLGNGSKRLIQATPEDRATPYRRSYVNDAVEVLRTMGRSMKLQELQSTIGHKRGKLVSLGSLKVCLSRYVDTNDASKLLTRVAPGLFALSEWHGGRSPRESAVLVRRPLDQLTVFMWTAQADRQLGTEEQRVYLHAENESDALARLELAGVPNPEKGIVEPRPGYSRRQAASSH
ncbi:MAG TPA: hypothetical protein VHZ07_09040 [Bryobacteraceae bacterium]|jgi:hypothetical protein|nr:hypothetical protein [Bryobacteraceae bacterium]